MDERKKKIAENIKIARKAAGLTQIELAEKAGVSQCQISDWERAAVMPELDSLLTLAPLLGVQVCELVDI